MNKRCTWLAALKPVFCTVLATALSMCAARAEDISGSAEVSGGGVVSFKNASSTNWVYNSSTETYDLVLVYTNPAATGAEFTLPGTTKAQILAVGGGGGGGGSYRSAAAYDGGGGGGGAGGLVYTNGLFGAGTYTLSVGSGGAGGVGKSSRSTYPGSNGEASKILLDAGGFIEALGGGGGGGESAGSTGGSGGGGSMLRVSSSSGTTKTGGDGTSGQGNKGGSGNASRYGGGGGGAGAEGANANGASHGVGGSGSMSDITGEEVWYAGGGGGGCNDKNVTTACGGGQGGGGAGAAGNTAAAQPGVDGTGGGGGGGGFGTAQANGAKGGDGIVIVRIQASLEGGLERPLDKVFEYDGAEHTSYATTAFYSVAGDNRGTAVGVYVAMVTPAEGIKWSDGSNDTVTVVMTITSANSKEGTVDITGAPVSYFGAAETNWVAVTNSEGHITSYDLLLKFTGAGGFTLPGTTKAQILAVGGGGGGGGSYRSAAAYDGGGGGGGAGGLVYTNALFGAGTYTLSVGSGGAGGVGKSSRSTYPGSNGEASKILLDAGGFIEALGGGGGGGESAGRPGGSGGGGSMLRASSSSGTTKDGGDGTSGQGNKGGSGNASRYGGGGGGAGAEGANANGASHGVGGSGSMSDITGEEVWYAGGGGGGCNDKNVTTNETVHPADIIISGGKGGGGSGAVGNTFEAQPGVDGTGGGGGGGGFGTAYANGAKGGDGIIYVRISMAMTGSLERPPETMTVTYDGNAHTSIVSCAFYDVAGDNIGTNAGNYTATATLKNDCTWLDGSTTPATVTMVIEPVDVALISLHQDGWTYNDPNPPDPVCEYNPTTINLVYEYADSEDASEWSAEKPVNAGTHWVRARAADQVNYRATPSELKAPFDISKVSVTFSDLKINDWPEGTPGELTPNPKCSVDPQWVKQYAVYEYADYSADPVVWSLSKPTVAGTNYVVRVRAPDTDNYAYEPAYDHFKIFKGQGATFTDYVEITVGGWAGSTPSVLTNFPYKLTLSEKTEVGPYGASDLVGFIYERAGLTGDDIAFTDDDGKVLCFYMKEWNPGGDSTVYVKIPEIGAEPQTIRLYWHLRAGQAAPEHNPGDIWSTWSEEEAAAIAQPAHSFGLVYRDVAWVNYFTQLPEMSRYEWESGDANPGTVTVPAVLADGDVVSTIIDAGMTPLAEMPTDKPGVYRIVFRPDDPYGEYDPIVYNIDFSIHGSLPMDDLTGGLSGDTALTVNGRVMLANDDGVEGYAVKGQAYWRTRVDAGGTTNDVFWTHSEDSGFDTEVIYFNGLKHRLNCIADGGSTNVLWRFDNVLMGNGFNQDGMVISDRSALPWSETSLGSEYEKRNVQGDNRESCNIIFPNVVDAAVYSPCYTNGIGTIYFDALNNTSTESEDETTNYCIVVEIATKTDDGLDPTDENSVEDGDDALVKLSNSWVPYAMIPLKRDGTGSFVAQPATNNLALSISSDRATDNFFRVCVPVNIRGPVRFRIRRASRYAGKGTYYRLILLDNIIVSYPGCEAALYPYGTYDGTRGGKQVLGQELAMANVPFPSTANADDMVARGWLDTYAGVATNANTASFVQSAKMHYRWRYISQDFDEWKTVQLSPFDDYAATEKMNVRAEPGDVEFWYELKTMMPYYSYRDYSGMGVGLEGLYTEEVTNVVCRMDLKAGGYTRLPSDGRDWFVRLREGASEWEGVSVVVDGAYSATQPMELISDHTWRGLVKVPSTNVSGSVTFSFVGRNRQAPGDRELSGISTTWRSKADVASLPSRGEAEAYTAGEPRMYEADGASGYIEFTFNDASLTFTIGHAEYQNFNAWHDANKNAELFVGTYTETSGVSSASMVMTNADMSSWPLLETGNSNWNEPFFLANYDDEGYPKGVSFSTHKMPGRWNGDNGKFMDWSFADSRSHSTGSGIAWQMQGEELGDITYTQSEGPAGLDTLVFSARLAQSLTFDDFSVWLGNDSLATNSYTLIVPAIMSSAMTVTASPPLSEYDFSPGATMSVVGYYQPKEGCYEARIERGNTDGIQISIYKWYLKKYRIVSECLTTHWFSGAIFWAKDTSSAPKPNMYAVLLSIGKDGDGKTTITAGLSRTPRAPTQSSSYSGDSYNLICVQDTSSPHTKGTYGVLSANCNGQFMYPRQYGSPISITGWSGAEPNRYATKAVALPSLSNAQHTSCRGRLSEAWAYTPGRTQCFTNMNYSGTPKPPGIRPPADLRQYVDLYLKSRDDPQATWGLVDSIPVTGYGSVYRGFVVRTNESCHVMMKTGEDPIDVTIHDITQTGWNGEDISNIGNLSREFVYTQARIVEEKTETSTNRYAVLQPARAVPGKALSLRSPVLKGLGMVSFSYKDVQPGCEVWLQAATNNVANNLSGNGGYNFTTNSVELGQPEPEGYWITLKKYTYDDLKDATMQLFSCGWHTSDDNPLDGVFRVVVAPHVVAAAPAHSMEGSGEWGSITITDMIVHDEPAIDTRSWLGWNLRTLGDDVDSERRMFLADSATLKSGSERIPAGLSAALNNSMTDDIDGDPSEYDKINPTIQSPTFGKYVDADTNLVQATIGLVRFRARLYETNRSEAVAGKVSLYGVLDGGDDDWGVALTNFTVDSSVYRPFEYRASSLKRFAAIRLVVDGVIDGSAADPKRVLLDEVAVSEIVKASVGFAYARPFRTGLEVDKEITNIQSMDQQPLTDESWGVQAQLKFDRYDAEIDTNRGFRVYFRYYKGTLPWGYEKWEAAEGASDWAELSQVGSYNDYIFRSSAASRATIVPSEKEANTVVQYMLYVRYYLKGVAEPQDQLIALSDVEGDGWTNPAWYEPVDYNKSELYGNGTYFSPYTILDGVSPGRVWINEVNYNDGTKAQTGGVKCETNQFIEIAVPWGVDLKGWKLVLTDMYHKTLTLAELGKNGVPASKKSTDGKKSGDYDFMVLQSPATRDAGGIKDYVTGQPVADGTWVSSTLSSTFKVGTLQYDQPYQLELFRPSGVLEHQFVVQGTNTLWEKWPEYALPYDGTNLVNELNILDEAAGLSHDKRFYAGEDTARRPSAGAVWSSLGVTGGAHGEDGGWTSEMRFTPGRRNEGQSELTDWYLKPHGASIWVYAKSLSAHVRQSIGEDTGQDTFVIVNSGDSTNITYAIDPWYAIGSLTVNGDPVASAAGATVTYQLNLNNITEQTTVVAGEGIDPQLVEAGLDLDDRYTPAIMNWLLSRAQAGTLLNPNGPISLGRYKGLWGSAAEHTMSLKMMYWFDLDPTDPGWWWRFGITDIEGTPVYRKREWRTYTEHLTNRQITVTMYLSNDTVNASTAVSPYPNRTAVDVYAPYRLQGLGNEQSDTFPGNWTSETFKVKVMLRNGLEHNAGFLPFRWFTFAPGSFGPASGAGDYASLIEILDPLSRSSMGYKYDWYGQSCNNFWFRISLDEDLGTGASIETLKADSSYGPPYEDDN